MKKIIKVLLMITCIFTMAACGSSKTDEVSSNVFDPIATFGEEGEKQLINYVNQYMTSLLKCTSEELETAKESYTQNGYETTATAIDALYNEATGYGSISGISDLVITEYGESSFIAECDVICEERVVECSMSYELTISDEGYLPILTSATATAVYTFAEQMEKAALNTLMGMGTVFAVLIFISFIISLFKYINVFENRMKEKNSIVANAAESAQTQITQAEENEEDLIDDLELVAVITAAIAASENTSTDGLVVRSIKRAENQKWRKRA